MRLVRLTLPLALALAACNDLPRQVAVPPAPALEQGKLLAYLKIVASDREPVGFVERRQQLTDDGARFEIDYVKSWDDFEVRGYIYGNGRAVKHVVVPPGLRKAEGRDAYDEALPESDRDQQIRRILDLPREKAPFTLVPASDADIRRTKPPEGPRR